MKITFMIKLYGRIYISNLKKTLSGKTVKRISEEYIQIMKRAKDIGSRNRLLMSYSLAAVFIAVNRCTALSAEENFTLLENAVKSSRIIKTFLGNADGYLSEKRMPGRKKWEYETKHSPYENDWEVTVLEGNGEYELGYDYTKCGVCRLCADEGCPELAAYNCRLDYTIAELVGMKLRRTMTIADGGDKCDFRYSRK